MRYDVSYQKQEEEESNWVKIGVAFTNPNDSITVKLDAKPLGRWDGKLWLFPKPGAPR